MIEKEIFSILLSSNFNTFVSPFVRQSPKNSASSCSVSNDKEIVVGSANCMLLGTKRF